MNIIATPKNTKPLSLWEPEEALPDMFGQLNQFINRIWREGAGAITSPSWSPGMDILNDDGELILTVDVPGMERKDIKVEIQDGVLTVSGERKLEKEEKKDNYVRLERGYGSFLRQFTLPEDVNQETVKATCKDGLLKITLTKKPGTKKEAKVVAIS